MRRFFYASATTPLAINQTITLPDSIFHHWCRVLRAELGETAILFDGQGGEYVVVLHEINKKSATVQVISFDAINRTLPFNVTIGLVMSRGDRMDYAIQKATEMGVTAIQLLTSQHGEVRLKSDQVQKKLEHWQQVAIAACEQCGLNMVPPILAPVELTDWIIDPTNNPNMASYDEKNHINASIIKLVLAVPQSQENASDNLSVTKPLLAKLQARINSPTSLHFYLLIGAEGGLSDAEVVAAQQYEFLPWQIGERVLRTETTPVVALSALQTIYELSHLPSSS